MKICPWEKVRPELKSLPIATVVWSLELPADEIIKTEQLCDTAWTEEAEVFSHHWMNPSFRLSPKVVSMPLGEYLLRHKEEIPAMNSFFGVNRVEFLRDLNLSLLSRDENND